MPNHERSRGKHALKRLNNPRMILLDILPAQRPPARERRVARGLALKHILVQIVECGVVGCAGGGVVDAQRVEVVEHGLEDSLQLGEGLADADEGVHVQVLAGGTQLVVDVQVVVDEVRAVGVEGADCFPEEGGVGGVGLVDVQVEAGAGRVVEGLVGCF